MAEGGNMKKLFVAGTLTAVLASLAGVVVAQQTHRVEVRSSGAAEDARPNSPSVPDVYAMSGQFDRVVILRFKYQTDLLAGMEKMVQEQKIRNAVILSAIGSVRNYQVHAVSNRTFPSHDTFVQDPTAPADVIGMNGYIINGTIHAHMTLATPERAFGGHLEPGTNVFTFVTVTMGVLSNGVDLSRIDDKTYR
jgi:predicted DNA-binding protein with PD1-like motif